MLVALQHNPRFTIANFYAHGEDHMWQSVVEAEEIHHLCLAARQAWYGQCRDPANTLDTRWKTKSRSPLGRVQDGDCLVNIQLHLSCCVDFLFKSRGCPALKLGSARFCPDVSHDLLRHVAMHCVCHVDDVQCFEINFPVALAPAAIVFTVGSDATNATVSKVHVNEETCKSAPHGDTWNNQ